MQDQWKVTLQCLAYHSRMLFSLIAQYHRAKTEVRYNESSLSLMDEGYLLVKLVKDVMIETRLYKVILSNFLYSTHV